MSKPKNVTFNLPPELIEKYKSYAAAKFIPSVNAAVREALEEYAIVMDKEILKKEMKQASKDPIFMKDLDDSMKAFQYVDKENDEEIPKW